MRINFIIIALQFILSNIHSQVSGYPYDTILSGGYFIHYVDDDSMQYIYLRKGDFSKELSSSSLGLPYQNLGFINADFEGVFILTHSFGSGNPHPSEIIEKATGLVLLSGNFIAVDQAKEYILLGDDDQCLILYNVKTRESQMFRYPKDISCLPPESCIKIEEISDRGLTISYDHNRKEKRMIYGR